MITKQTNDDKLDGRRSLGGKALPAAMVALGLTLGFTAGPLSATPRPQEGLNVRQADAIKASDRDTTVSGRGWLAARGTGTITIEGGGWFKMQIDGDLTIEDLDGDAQFFVAGDELVPESGLLLLTEFDGVVAVRGSDLSIAAEGTVAMRAHGRGEATLIGDGVFRTRHGDPTVWDGFVQMGTPEVQSADAVVDG